MFINMFFLIATNNNTNINIAIKTSCCMMCFLFPCSCRTYVEYQKKLCIE